MGRSFLTTATHLEVDARGAMWLLRDERHDDAQLFSAPVLERYGPSGRLEKRVALDAGALVRGFVVHPSSRTPIRRCATTRASAAPRRSPRRERATLQPSNRVIYGFGGP